MGVMKPALIYSDKLKVSFNEHIFPVEKYQLLMAKVEETSVLTNFELFEPEPAPTADLLLVHLPDYVKDFMNFEYTEATVTSELPLNKEIRDFFLLTTGGTIKAAALSLERGAAFNVGGGWHHAFPDHAEGFCYLNDVAIAIRKLQKGKKVKKFAVIDGDLHQGNGTAFIFQRDADVFTFSVHQENLYPVKQKSSLDIGLPDYAGDDLYVKAFQEHIPVIYEQHQPELIAFVAGADPYKEDQLGNLQVTMQGLQKRDEIVIGEAKKRNIPLFVVLAGGYSRNTEDVVNIHFQTLKVLAGVRP